MEWPLRALSAVAVLISIINALAIWMQWGKRALASKVEQMSTVLDQHDSRIQAIESEIKHLPTKESLHDLTVQVTAMSGKLGGFDTELGSVSRTVRRIEDHLMRGKAQ